MMDIRYYRINCNTIWKVYIKIWYYYKKMEDFNRYYGIEIKMIKNKVIKLKY